MTYTPTDQLPPPPQWMLDEVEAAEQAHLTDLMNKCFTIGTFRKHILPIYYKYKSATGKIMGDAIEEWKQHQRDEAEYRIRYCGWPTAVPLYENPNYLKNPSMSFHRRFMNAHDYDDNGHYRADHANHPCFFKSPCGKKVLAKRKLIMKMGRQFIAYKNGKVPETRMKRFRNLEFNYHYPHHGNFWAYMEKFKENKFKAPHNW
jgi:hypothetical protein